MGAPAVPLIQSLLEDGKCERAPDFFLARAVIQIRGWKEQDFVPAGRRYPETEQALCASVLERLRA